MLFYNNFFAIFAMAVNSFYLTKKDYLKMINNAVEV